MSSIYSDLKSSCPIRVVYSIQSHSCLVLNLFSAFVAWSSHFHSTFRYRASCI